MFTPKISDNGSNTSLRNIDKIIKETFEVCEKFDFKNMSLWEIFQYNFKSFIEGDFKSASIHYQNKV